jgi:GAF domain-containing protein
MEEPAVAAPLNALFDPNRLLALYADMNRTLLEPGHGTDIMAAITRLAVAAIPGVEQASISEGRDGRFRTLASTGDIATIGDLIQYQLASGPCVDAIIDDTVYRSNDLAADTRWPQFGTRAHAETGATSMMSLRLFIEGDERIAGLNLYSTRPDAFDDSAYAVANLVATHCATALIAASARERVENLQRALTSNRRIGMAMGVLMATHKLTETDAFTLLRIASQNSNRKLTDIADDVITTGTLELPPPRPAKPSRRPSLARPDGPNSPA